MIYMNQREIKRLRRKFVREARRVQKRIDPEQKSMQALSWLNENSDKIATMAGLTALVLGAGVVCYRSCYKKR